MEAYRVTLRINPKYVAAHCNLGNIYKSQERFEDAETCYQEAVRLNSGFTEALYNLGTIRMKQQRYEEAKSFFEGALKSRPDFHLALNGLGKCSKSLGQLDVARRSLERAIEIKPDLIDAHKNLSTLLRYSGSEPQIATMLKLYSEDGLNDKQRTALCFALGKAHGDFNDVDNAFSFYQEGNKLRKKTLPYSYAAEKAYMECLKQTFAGDKHIDAVTLPGEKIKQLPVFVVGMPRSGTSLLEQILASHSKIFGAGELDILTDAVGIPAQPVDDVSHSRLSDIREKYLSGLNSLAASQPIIVDKMPQNFQLVGYILSAIPEAKIIHIKRDARAICWSLFKLNFAPQGHGYAYDLHDVGMYYRLYEDLMQFWNATFPDRIINVQYEELTENQVAETERLLNKIGLSWEDQCRDFHNTDRAVSTASSVQVRQEMYQGSSEAWRAYEKYLQPMLSALSSSTTGN